MEDNKKALFESRLQQRREEAERQKQIRNMERSEKAAPSESIEEFWKQFNGTKNDVTAKLQDLIDNKPKSKEEAAAALDGLNKTLNELQEKVADATLFLASYDTRSAQQTLSELFDKVRDSRALLVPRSKFSFAKARKVKDESTPTTAANTTTEAVPAANATLDAATTTVSSATKRVFDLIDERVLEDKSGEKLIVMPEEGLVQGRDVRLSRLTNCTIYLLDVMGALRMDNLADCTVYSGPIAGSAFFEKCTNCTFIIASRQIRIHHSYNTDFYLQVSSNPIIEDCKDIRFSPYNLTYEGIEGHFVTSALDRSFNMWDKVNDFKWHRSQHSPNWSILPSEMKKIEPHDTSLVQLLS